MPARKPCCRADERIERLAGGTWAGCECGRDVGTQLTGDAYLWPPDEYLEREAVFGVKASLIGRLERQAADVPTPDGRRIDGPRTSARFDIVLASVEDRARRRRPSDRDS